MNIPVEIERKFVISMPDVSELSVLEGYSVSEIEQTYLESSPDITHRVRKRKYSTCTVYTETKKTRIDRMSAFEDEREITKEEYEMLLGTIMPGTATLRKTRHTFRFSGFVFEIDIYPQWKGTAILEVELDSQKTEIEMPGFINVIDEVTGDKKYSNASMSMTFPEELV